MSYVFVLLFLLIVISVLFLISALVQFALGRHHKKEKRFGPSPKNNYTRGSGVKFWQRRKAKKAALRDPEMAGAIPATGTGTHAALAPGAPDYRASHDTGYTGTTAARESATYDTHHKPMQGGYHTAPTGTYAQYNANASPATNY